MNLVAHGETHPGYVRTNNEDALLLLPQRGLIVVADGMAGHRFGELASAIAINTIRRFYLSDELNELLVAQFKRAKKANLEPKNAPFELFKLRRALEEANLAIFNTARRNPQYETMGTTIVAAVFGEKSLYLAHVGDSRIYRLRGGKLKQLTSDHSLLNEYIRLEYVSAEDADTFPLKNVIVRALGLQEQVTVEAAIKTARSNDYLVLCTDGLSDLVSAEEIAEGLLGHDEPKLQVKDLIERALRAGGVDNITVAVVKLAEETE